MRVLRRSVSASAILAGSAAAFAALASLAWAGEGPTINPAPRTQPVQINPPLAAAPSFPAPQPKPSQVRISAADCRRAVAHQPRADVEYKPGVDARGRKVAPADLQGQQPQIKLPDVISFDVKIDFAK